MATSGVTLQMKFGTASGTKTWNLKYAKADLTGAQVSSLMDTMITNGSIYQYPPLTKDSAALVVTTVTDLYIEES